MIVGAVAWARRAETVEPGQDPVEVACVAAADDDKEREARRVGQDSGRSPVD